jgi:hypothetical protein
MHASYGIVEMLVPHIAEVAELVPCAEFAAASHHAAAVIAHVPREVEVVAAMGIVPCVAEVVELAPCAEFATVIHHAAAIVAHVPHIVEMAAAVVLVPHVAEVATAIHVHHAVEVVVPEVAAPEVAAIAALEVAAIAALEVAAIAAPEVAAHAVPEVAAVAAPEVAAHAVPEVAAIAALPVPHKPIVAVVGVLCNGSPFSGIMCQTCKLLTGMIMLPDNTINVGCYCQFHTASEPEQDRWHICSINTRAAPRLDIATAYDRYNYPILRYQRMNIIP